MRAADEDALICDMMEYYRIDSIYRYTPDFIATLACGLPMESRIRRSIGGREYGISEYLLAGILDQLRILNWSRTKDARHKRNFPKSILTEMINGKQDEEKDEIRAFETGQDFMREFERINGTSNGGSN